MRAWPASGIVFSRNRAMQLDAALRSLYRHAPEAAQMALTVLYRADTAQHARQYGQLEQAFREYPHLHWQSQRHFRRQTLDALLRAHGLNGTRLGLARLIVRLHRRLGWLAAPLLGGEGGAFLFLVDDAVFTRPPQLALAAHALQADPEALGFSLRLGRNTTWCYTHVQAQALPYFRAFGGGALAYDWPGAAFDFGYPLEVSSSLYRTADLLPWLAWKPFANPNQLESRLSEAAARFVRRPRLLCLETSAAFCNPVNKVQEAYQNRAGQEVAYSEQELADRFERGERIDIAALDGYVAKGCHEEVAFRFGAP